MLSVYMMSFLVAVASPSDENPATASVAQPQSNAEDAPSSPGPWTMGVAADGLLLKAPETEWMGGAHRPGVALTINYDVSRWLPGLALEGALVLRPGPQATVVMSHWEGELALVYNLPVGAVGTFAQPYVRAGLLGGWIQASLDSLETEPTFVPGLSGAAGVRFPLTMMPENSKQIRLFAFVEGAYSLRTESRLRIVHTDSQTDDALSGPPTRLGDLEMGGAQWRVGFGFHL